MIYLSQLTGIPVLDNTGQKIGSVSDLGIATGEVFPRITSLAFMGPGRAPFMISWRKYVESYSEKEVRLKVQATDIRFSYLQPDEVLLSRDILNKQIVDTQGMRVVRVNDLKLSDTNGTQLRLLGAEVGVRGILRSLSPALEHICMRVARSFGKPLHERIIAWSYMDLVERDLSNVKLSVSHKTLDELHPADIADIIERLDPRLRGQVFAQLDDEQRADALAEFDDDAMAAELMGELNESDASRMLSEMDPDDAAELVSELDYEKAEKLLRLMGVNEQKAVRQLLGYKEYSAGRIMTSECAVVFDTATVADAIDYLKSLDDDFEAVRYIYLVDAENKLVGAASIMQLIVHKPTEALLDLATTNLIVAAPDDDQEQVAQNMAKYNLLAIPVVADNGRLLGIVTVDDALDVMEEEHAEDLQIAGSGDDRPNRAGAFVWLVRRNTWFFLWIAASLLCSVLFANFFAVPPQASLVLFAVLPIALVLADDSATYTTNFFLEYDPDDESTPSDLAFGFKSIFLGLAFALLLWLLGRIVLGVLSDGLKLAYAGTTVLIGFKASAIAVFAAYAITPLYLLLLRKRDKQNKETSGFALSVFALIISLMVFIAAVGLMVINLNLLGLFA